jgi:hypothetical protein
MEGRKVGRIGVGGDTGAHETSTAVAAVVRITTRYRIGELSG